MPRHALLATAAAVLLAFPAAAEVTEQNFRGGRTADLAALCGAGPQDPMHTAAVNWCHGFMVGAGQYHRSSRGGTGQELFCLPSPEPTLEQARSAFVAWAARHPEHAGERAVDGLTRFATETWPCPHTPVARQQKR